MRTINDFNSEYLYRSWLSELEAAGKPRKGRTIRNIAFYGVLVIMLLLAFFYSGSKEPGKRFGPFAYNTVLTPSMQSVYPTGSLIISWAVKPGEPLEAGLENGTDIVYIKEDGMVVVHRIIEIMENYEDSGRRAFRTQGVDNPAPDTWITDELNIIGRVTFCIPVLGECMAFVANNILLVIGGVVLLTVVFSLWKTVFSKEKR